MKTSPFSFKKTTHYHKNGRQQCNGQWFCCGILSQKEEQGENEKCTYILKQSTVEMITLQHC